jgi:hypothetical protein
VALYLGRDPPVRCAGAVPLYRFPGREQHDQPIGFVRLDACKMWGVRIRALFGALQVP